MSMNKIEVGKSYRTRDGRKADVLGVQEAFITTEGACPFYGVVNGDVHNWTVDGRWATYHPDHPLDLVSEWVDEPQKNELDELRKEVEELKAKLAALAPPPKPQVTIPWGKIPVEVVAVIQDDGGWFGCTSRPEWGESEGFWQTGNMFVVKLFPSQQPQNFTGTSRESLFERPTTEAA